MIAEDRAFNPELRAYAFINRADATGTENIEAAEYIQDTQELEFIDTPLGYRKIFGKAASQGLSVIEHKPTDSKAIAPCNCFVRSSFCNSKVEGGKLWIKNRR